MAIDRTSIFEVVDVCVVDSRVSQSSTLSCCLNPGLAGLCSELFLPTFIYSEQCVAK